jgi:hydroxyethylthiazole kinase
MQHPQIALRHSVITTACAVLARLRERGPRVHCITNTVAQSFTANVLLAAGCLPSMTLSPDEIEPFIAGAEGLLVNLGTLDRERREAIAIAVKTAAKQKLTWVLDPVFVDRVPARARFAHDLLASYPTAVRLNHAEFLTVAGNKPSPDAVKAYARDRRIVVGLSGETDLVTDGERIISVTNGHRLMSKVTAMGCATSAMVAACLAAEPDALKATVVGLIMVGVAGELAAERSEGPGSFATAFIDCLYTLDESALTARARVS